MAASPKAKLPSDLGSHKGRPYEPIIVGCPQRATPLSLSIRLCMHEVVPHLAHSNGRQV